METSKFAKLLEEIPVELRAVAGAYVPVFEEFTDAKIHAFVDLILGEQPTAAYQHVVNHLSTEDLLVEGARLNGIFLGLNDEHANQNEAKKRALHAMLRAVISTGLSAMLDD